MKTAMENLISEREAQLIAKPWFLLNSQIPIGQYSNSEKIEVEKQLSDFVKEGKNLDHISWKFCG